MNMKSKIAIVDYGMGNLRSVVNAFTFVGARVKVTNNPKELAKAAGVVVPGQGAIRDCVANLHKLNLVKLVVRFVSYRSFVDYLLYYQKIMLFLRYC